MFNCFNCSVLTNYWVTTWHGEKIAKTTNKAFTRIGVNMGGSLAS